MNNAKANELLLKVKYGDNDAFGQLYELTKNGVFSFIYSITQDYTASEDIMQDTYLTVKNYASSYQNGNATAWILQIAKNLSLNYIKKRKRVVLQEDVFEGSYSHSDEQLTGSPTICAMNKVLNAEERQILTMRVVGGYKHREIAKMLDLPLGTVTWTYSAALKKMRKYLSKKEESDD